MKALLRELATYFRPYREIRDPRESPLYPNQTLENLREASRNMHGAVRHLLIAVVVQLCVLIGVLLVRTLA